MYQGDPLAFDGLVSVNVAQTAFCDLVGRLLAVREPEA